jgi:hypothetical protein
VQAAINSGQRAAAEREQELWNEYRQRLAAKPQPPEMLF